MYIVGCASCHICIFRPMEPYHREPSLAGTFSSTQAGGPLFSKKEGREGWCVHLQMSLTGWETEAEE